ncbi:MAG: hypothetical protein NZM35_05345 [Chitinophagales bacterium]|nr:hypothetical protein [Chitinophagales bacterium]MDW8418537.1 hypothetical protein [Chitinophagales bacterium]
MYVKHLIDKILITLEVGGRTALFILLDKYGNIHRKGNGNPNDNTQSLQAGVSRQGHFDALMMTIDESIFQYAGVMRMPGIQGEECRLSIIFNGNNGEVDYGFRVVYGSESVGPPAELAQILINAVKITEPWYQEQLQNSTNEKRKWWE